MWRWGMPVLLVVVTLGALIGGPASDVGAATPQPASPSKAVAEERFLQQFINRALDQKDSAPKGSDTATRDATASRRDPEPVPPLKLSNTDRLQLQYKTVPTTMVMALGVTLAILGISVYLARRYLFKPRLFGKRENPLRVVARVNLTPKAAVTLLEAPGKLLVVGVTGTTLTALGEIPLAPVDGKTGRDPDRSISFATTLDQQSESGVEPSAVDASLLRVSERIQRKVSGLKQL